MQSTINLFDTEMDDQHTDAKNIKKIKVLIIEDEIINQKIAKSFLEILNYEVEIAATAEQAPAMLNDSYDAILTDIGLPDGDGRSITRSIRQKSKHIPIIAASAFVKSEIEASYLAAGINKLISKPIVFDELNQILQVFFPTNYKAS